MDRQATHHRGVETIGRTKRGSHQPARRRGYGQKHTYNSRIRPTRCLFGSRNQQACRIPECGSADRNNRKHKRQPFDCRRRPHPAGNGLRQEICTRLAHNNRRSVGVANGKGFHAAKQARCPLACGRDRHNSRLHAGADTTHSRRPRRVFPTDGQPPAVRHKRICTPMGRPCGDRA